MNETIAWGIVCIILIQIIQLLESFKTDALLKKVLIAIHADNVLMLDEIKKLSPPKM